MSNDTNALVERLRIRASIRRRITTRKSVQEGKPDRIADLLEEAATALERAEAEGSRKGLEEACAAIRAAADPDGVDFVLLGPAGIYMRCEQKIRALIEKDKPVADQQVPGGASADENARRAEQFALLGKAHASAPLTRKEVDRRFGQPNYGHDSELIAASSLHDQAAWMRTQIHRLPQEYKDVVKRLCDGYNNPEPGESK